MRRSSLTVCVTLALAGCAGTVGGTAGAPAPGPNASLDDANRARQAIDRLTFGARPGDLARVEHMGVDKWVDLQLHPERIPDRAADSVLAHLDITGKTAFELFADHPQPNEYRDTTNAALTAKRREEAPALLRSRTDAIRELAPSIMLRATVSDRQLLEVMTVFWENHFSVSTEKMPSPWTLVDYDRAIHAHALGKFRDLLGVVATSPAMLFYLDNYQSAVDSLHPNPAEWEVETRRRTHPPLGDTTLAHTVHRRGIGVNENYARELMELHTLGVDGGYTQQDVQEVARCLTGWGIDNPQMGGTFSFQPARHDAGEKTVLGVHIPGGRGIEDGQEVLDILARSPATARFIAKKLVVHFVSDSAPPALVERAAQTYLRTDGDIREVLRTIFTSPEFNSGAAYRAKVKTPFELVASVMRAMEALPDTTPRSAALVASLGQPIFGRSTPDGWPDQAASWMNAGALIDRVNLGVRVGANQFPNVLMSRWQPGLHLEGQSPAQITTAIDDALLMGDASPATRNAMLGVAQPRANAAAQQWFAYIGTLAGIAIGSLDFQRR
ncbi:MAG TPA: DUF1800 domain-containing protein [Gemmatimonadaceae bacterium]|jgi:uncharacterized protein (DUF1800 family)